ETFTVTLSDPADTEPSPTYTDAFAIAQAAAFGTILNDDAGVSIAAADAVKFEGNSGTTPFTFTVTRTGDTSFAASVGWSVSVAGTGASADANDFGGSLAFGQVTFGSGETSKTITVSVTGDATVEPDETFAVTLAPAPGPANVMITRATAAGTILN